jgi:hypothetical protein
LSLGWLSRLRRAIGQRKASKYPAVIGNRSVSIFHSPQEIIQPGRVIVCKRDLLPAVEAVLREKQCVSGQSAKRQPLSPTPAAQTAIRQRRPTWSNASWSTLLCRVEPSPAVPSASSANSDFGVVNREKPQSKQTKSVGNNKTPGLSMFLRPWKWMFISLMNSA